MSKTDRRLQQRFVPLADGAKQGPDRRERAGRSAREADLIERLRGPQWKALIAATVDAINTAGKGPRERNA